MAWRQEFLDFISADVVTPVYLFESVDLVQAVAGDFGDGKPMAKFASAAIGDGEHTVAIDRTGCSVTYGTLTPGEWSRSYGTLTVGLTEDPRPVLTRGQAVALYVGAPGWSYAQFEHVWLGTVRQIRYSGGRWAVDCVEMPGSLQNRYSSTQGEQSLFYSTFADTTLAADYDPNVDTTLDVTSAAAWASLPPDSDDVYGLVIEPASGSPYFVLADTLAGTTFGGLNDNVFGTSAVAASAGDAVRVLVLTDAHPIYAVLRVLVASGTGGDGGATLGINGPFDLLPVNWGYGIRDHFVDAADATYFAVASGAPTVTWRLWADGPETDGLRWLTEWLQPGGFFLALHQGLLTVRCVIGNTGVATPGSVVIDDTDIVELSYETWDADSPIEYRVSRCTSASGIATSDVSEPNVATRPSKARRRRDLLGAWDVTLGEGVADAAVEEVAERLAVFDTRIPERVSVVTAGWAAGVASLGDVVYLRTDLLVRRTYPAAGGTFDGTPGVVVGGGVDWFGATTSLEILFPGQTASLE